MLLKMSKNTFFPITFGIVLGLIYSENGSESITYEAQRIKTEDALKI
jgi:hypothetical protein